VERFLEAQAGRWLAVAGASLVAALGTATSAALAKPASPFVPLSGTAGQATYQRWLAAHWQTAFRHPDGQKDCQPVTVNGRPGRLLNDVTRSRHVHYGCSIAAGTTLYVGGPSAECSTVPGDHPDGTTDAELARCAAKELGSVADTTSLTVDDVTTRLSDYKVSAGPFPVHQPKTAHQPAAAGHSFAVGEGVVVAPLAAGDHLVTLHYGSGAKAIIVQWALHVG
jgi:hypothetical protein